MKATTKIGSIIGILASVYLAILAIVGNFGGSALKYGKYVFFVAGLLYFYTNKVKTWPYEQFVGKYISSALFISFISSIIIGISNAILFIIEPSYAIQKYNFAAESFAQLVMIDGVIIVETVVLGLLVAFVIFPFFKNIPHRNNNPRGNTKNIVDPSRK